MLQDQRAVPSSPVPPVRPAGGTLLSVPAPAGGAAGRRARLRAAGPRLARAATDVVAVGVLLALMRVVYDLPVHVWPPYWLDEAWVAASVRYPLADLPALTASTPIGWAALLRLVPDEDQLRVVPLLFKAGSIVAAYVLGRSLLAGSHAGRVVCGLAAGAAVLVLPAQQVRLDLKHYTADAAVALGLLCLAAWIEGRWSRRRLATLPLAVAAGVLVSQAGAILAFCVAGGLVLVPLARRRWRAAAEAAVAGLLSGLVVVGAYLAVASRGDNSTLENYWAGYLPRLADLPGYLVWRLTELEWYLGTPWQVMVALAGLGVLVLAVRGRPATAVAAGLLAPTLIALGVARVYPLLNPRTSHFVMCVLAALAAIGVAGAVFAVPGFRRIRTARRWPGWPARVARVVCAVLLAGVALDGYVERNESWLRFNGRGGPLNLELPMLVEDARRATRYVAQHRRPQDVILVNSSAAYGFAFYWRQDTPGWRPQPATAVGWLPDYPPRTGIVIARDHSRAEINAAAVRARRLAHARGPDAQIWLIRSHMQNNAEIRWWIMAYRGYPTFNQKGSGKEPVTVIRPRSPRPKARSRAR